MVKDIYKTLLVVLTLLLLSSASYAIKDFTISPVQTTTQSQVNEPVQFQVNIDNTGDESINLTVDNLILSDGVNSFTFNPNTSELLNFNSTDQIRSIVFDNSSLLNEVGKYTGDLTVEDSQNASFTKSVTFELDVVDERSLENPSISFPSSITQGDTVTYSVTLKNNGTLDINDAQITFQIPNIGISETQNVAIIQGGTQVITFDVTIPQSASSQNTNVDVDVNYADNTKQVSTTDSFFILPDETVFIDGFGEEITLSIDLDDTDDTKRLSLVNSFDTSITDIVLSLQSDIGDFEIEDHIEFEETGDDTLDVDEDDRDEEYELGPGGSYSFILEFDNLDEIELREHFGSNSLRVEYQLDGQTQTFSKSFDIRVETEKDDFDIEFVQREYEIRVERDDDESIDLDIDNNEDFDIEDVSILIGDEFELTTDGSEELSSSNFEFDVSSPFTLREGSDEVELTVEADDNDRIGTYEGTIILERNGDEIDEISVRVTITDGISILSVTPQEDAKPDENLIVDVVIENTKSLAEVEVRGEFRNINSRGLDVIDSEVVLLPSRDQKTIRLNFEIPSDVRDGDLLLDLFVEYDDPEDRDDRVQFRDEYTIPVDRQSIDFQIRTAFVSPQVISCDNEIDTRMTVRNIGVSEGDVDLTVSVQGEPNLRESRSYSIQENEERTFISSLDISNLEVGRYNVEFLAEFDGDERSRTVSFRKEVCSNNGGGTTNPTPNPNPNNETQGGNSGGSVDDSDSNGNIVLNALTNPTVILSIIAFSLLIIVIIVAVLVL